MQKTGKYPLIEYIDAVGNTFIFQSYKEFTVYLFKNRRRGEHTRRADITEDKILDLLERGNDLSKIPKLLKTSLATICQRLTQRPWYKLTLEECRKEVLKAREIALDKIKNRRAEREEKGKVAVF
jgi:hypothetical protein